MNQIKYESSMSISQMPNKVDVLDMFTIPLIHVELIEDTDELKGCKEYLNSSIQSKVGKPNNMILEKYPKIKEILTNNSNSALKDILTYDAKFKITTSWITKTKQGQKCFMHNHKNCMFSAVYYYSDYDDDTGKLVFDNPFKDMSSYMVENEQDDPFNRASIKITPRSKSLIIFPSFMKHVIDVHKSKQPRLSLAFNLIPVGKYGYGDSFYDTTLI